MEIALELTVEEINYILELLSDKPYKEVAGIITKIKAQGDDQLDPKVTAPMVDDHNYEDEEEYELDEQ